MGDLRHAIFAGGFSAIASSRADRWLRPFAQGCGLILTFHHVRPDAPGGGAHAVAQGQFRPNRSLEVTPAFLEATLEALAHAGFECVSMDEVPERLDASRRGRPFAVITFDDGYRDNVEHAWPILRRRNVPWTLYVVPRFADGRGVLWWIDLERAIAGADSVVFRVGEDVLSLQTATPAQKAAAFAGVARRLRAAGGKELRGFVMSLAEREGRDPAATSRELCADWEDIAALARDPLVTIGAHSMSHPVLSRETAETVLEELGESRRVIAGRLRRPVRHLAYPHGDREAVGVREHVLARAAGFTTAVTTRPGHLWPAHRAHCHALPRLSMNGRHQTDAALRALLSGVPFLAGDLAQRLHAATVAGG
ncbi:peptidoglycan/xylan/chitin deacetylase (PgdA/CDA1 family) [Pseudochelatococcus lubricantis]|uniref:Chitooligosaccharide deacetylase n=1 Tax=Pseudochelatococcus lubricantis TaxID=1538102 RepID=A0ABX0UZ87_9HYPH|nr:polysaccharide deacetylase family protein [Pseudochelatococcus lubricantis]NIJ58047.1 peptidoglycan/xylan/chitin deacetylase (PgdA/CDA1 family) [Pseudochelatococcus lubricantis]